MNVEILPGCLSGTVSAIPSKSQAHRALICAALSDSPTRIECRGESEDITATIACLSALGADISRKPDGYAVIPIRGFFVTGQRPVLNCNESGSTFRFMLPIVCALGRETEFVMKGRLPRRPLSPLYEELIAHGCKLSQQGAVPFICKGQLKTGLYTLDAGVSSQFISGLLFALPLLDGDSELRLTGRAESFPYIELTLAMLETFGVKISFNGEFFSTSGGQKYRSPGTALIEGDWSNAAFWLCAGAIGANVHGAGVTCTGLDLRSKQGDRAVIDILAGSGARVEAAGSAVTVSGGRLNGIEIDARDIPDLVPVLAVVAAAAEGTTVIRNAGRLRVKESDRLAAIAAVLCGLGADAKETEDGLIIHGGPPLTGGLASSRGDHRIAMAAAIAAGICSGPVVIQGAEAVNKSYPGFFEDLRLLRGAAPRPA